MALNDSGMSTGPSVNTVADPQNLLQALPNKAKACCYSRDVQGEALGAWCRHRTGAMSWNQRIRARRTVIWAAAVALAFLSLLALPADAIAQPWTVEAASALNNEGGRLKQQGRYAEAEAQYKQSLEVLERAVGPGDPRVAGVLNNLADLYTMQGRYAEAEPLLKRSLDIVGLAAGSETPDVATMLGNLANLYAREGRYADAEPLFKRSVAIDERALPPDHPNLGRHLNNLAEFYRQQGRHAEAEPLYKSVLAIFEKAVGPEHPVLAASLNNLGLLYTAQGRHADAEPLIKRALAIAEKALGPEHPDTARYLSNLGSLYQAQGRYTEAEPLFRRSLAISERTLGPAHPNVAATRTNLALVYRAQGRLSEAEPLFRRALAIAEKALGPDHPDIAVHLTNLGGIYYDQGRFADAEPLVRRSLAILERAYDADHPTLIAILSRLAELSRARRDGAAALAYSRRATAIMAQRGRGAAPAGTSGALAEQRTARPLYVQGITLAHDADGAAAAQETFRLAQLAAASDTGRAVAGMTARFAAGNGALARLVRERQDLVERRLGLDAALVRAVSRPPSERDAAGESRARSDLAAVAGRLAAVDGQLAAGFPGYAELSDPKPLDAAAAQELLGTDEALLVYLVDEDATWIWVLRRDVVAMHRIGIGAAALSRAVRDLRASLNPQLNPAQRPYPATKAHDLYMQVLAPALPQLSGARHILVVADGALESLPLGVLVTKRPAKDPTTLAGHRDVAWVARDYAVTVLPAVSSFRALRQMAPSAGAQRPFLGVGNPVLTGPAGTERGRRADAAQLFRGGAMADVAQVRALPPLPETALELRLVARRLGAGAQDLYLAERASEPALRAAALDRYRVIMFATHALMSGEMTGLAEPALVLTPPRVASAEDDGLLTASKVASLRLNADWVVLSACDTAAGDGTPDGRGLSGLAKAFFYAGSRALLVSHWPVVSDAAVLLTTRTFAALADDPRLGRAEALRRTEMALLDDRSLPDDIAHPMMWGAFSLAGEARRR